MIASRNPHAASEFRGVNVILRADGSEVRLDDIATADEGQRLLDEVDAAILSIEDQVEHYDGGNDDWRRRAGLALKKKRRIRPALQRRIAELRRAERQAVVGTGPDKATFHKDARRKAFVVAAEQMLDRELFVEIWQRASENEPAVFEGWEGVSA